MGAGDRTLTKAQHVALAVLADMPRSTMFLPTPEQRSDFLALVELGLAKPYGEGLGGDGFAVTPAGRRAAARAAGGPRSGRGFASMSPERRREIAAKGGASVPADKRAFATDRELASTAGRRGGKNSRGPRPKLEGGDG
jgi:general stress protein YciG